LNVPGHKLVLLFLLVGTLPQWAADQRVRGLLKFETLSLEDGLSQSSVYDSLQDPFGFLWVATEDGLNRYDGCQFIEYRQQSGEPNALYDSFITKLHLDARGQLWVGTNNGGLSRYRDDCDCFETFLHDPQDPRTLPSNHIADIISDGFESLWVATRDHGLARRMPGLTTFERVGGEDGSFGTHQFIGTGALYIDSGGNLWVGSAKGLFRLPQAAMRQPNIQPQDFEAVSLAAPGESQPDQTGFFVRTITQDQQGRLWVGTSTDGLRLLTPREDGSFAVKAFRFSPRSPTSLGSNNVHDVMEDRDGRIWIATDPGGLNLFTDYRDQFQRFMPSRTDPHSISTSRVWSLSQDRSGLIWIGTFVGGLAKLDLGKGRFNHWSEHSPLPTQLSNDYVKAITRDDRGRLWVGHSMGIDIFMEDQDEMVKWHLKADPENERSLSTNAVRCFAQAADGTMWVGTWGHGVNLINPDSGTAIEKSTSIGATPRLSNDLVRSILKSREGVMWVGTSIGLNRYDPVRGSFTHFLFHQDNNPDSDPNRIATQYEDAAGILWLGTDGGLISFNPATGTSRRWKRQIREASSLSNNRVRPIFQDADGIFWLGTGGGGLNRFDPATETFRVFSKRDGLPNDVIYGILPDNEGFLWLSTNSGLCRFDPMSFEVRNFTEDDGLQGNEFNLGAQFRDRDGVLFFGGINGLNRFDPAKLSQNRNRPPVVVTGIQRGRDAEFEQRIFPDSSSFSMPHSSNLVVFEFAALDFTSPKQNRFRYKLEGFDAEWHDAGTINRTNYTNLDPGTYKFRVIGSNNDATWNEEGTTMVLHVIPPWWRTIWAYLAYILLFLGFLYMYLRFQRHRLEHERAVNERYREIDRLKDEFLATTSHELRTPLNGMIGLAEALLDGSSGNLPATAKRSLSMIVASGARLANLVNDILDFSRMRQQRLSLQIKPLDLHSFTEMVLALTEPLANPKKLQLVNHLSNHLPPVYADENRLQQILHNLIGNAIKFTERGMVKISAKVEQESMIVCVADTGRGIPAGKMDRIFESFEQVEHSETRDYGGSGLGLAITKKLVEMHGGRIWVESALGIGSRFYFSLPLAHGKSMQPPDQHEVMEVMAHESHQDYEENTDPGNNYNGFHVLAVDDEPINLAVIQNHLTPRGYRVTSVRDGREALKKLEKGHDVDLVLLDLMMPNMSGFEVCEAIRKDYSSAELPVIVVSAKDRVIDLIKGLQCGANDYITKPISKDLMLARMANHIELLKNSRKLRAYNQELETEVRRRTQSLQQRSEELEHLNTIVRAINEELALESVLNRIVEEALRIFPQADRSAFLLHEYDVKPQQFTIAAQSGYGFGKGMRLHLPERDFFRSDIAEARRIQAGVYVLRKLPAGAQQLFVANPPAPAAILAMTVLVEDQHEGYLLIDSIHDPLAFGETDLEMLSRLRDHVTSAIVKVRLLEQLQAKNEEILKTQRRLVTQEKMASLGVLTAGVAHEIKNPLNFINNFASGVIELVKELNESLAEVEHQLTKEHREEIDEIMDLLTQTSSRICENGKRADNIIHSMMDLSRKGSSRARVTDINKMMQQYVELAYHGWRHRYKDLQVSLHWELDPDLGHLNVVAENLGRVVVNLVTNACYALREKKLKDESFEPRLEIKTLKTESHAQIMIHDNGTGIPESAREFIFTPFFTTKPPGAGNTGLGLSLSYEIVVHEHEGQLKARTEEGQFTEFIILLPLKTSEPIEEPQQQDEELQQQDREKENPVA
jgi:signal transduction histidine kinase/ligand-binding sensor domain-containing protein/DNA-binding response OmpR family regulator